MLETPNQTEIVPSQEIEGQIVEQLSELEVVAGDIKNLYNIFKVKTSDYKQAFAEGNFDPITLILNTEDEQSNLKQSIKETLLKASEIKKSIKLASSWNKQSLFKQYIGDIEVSCEILTTILLIKQKQQQGDNYASLVTKLNKLYQTKYGEISKSYINTSLNRPEFSDKLKLLEDIDPQLHARICSKTDQYISSYNTSLENYPLEKYTRFQDTTLATQKQYLPKDLLKMAQEDPTQPISGTDMLTYAQQTIVNMGEIFPESEDWQAIHNEDPESTTFSVSENPNRINVSQAPRKIEDFIGVLKHEICVHAQRYSLGKQNKLLPSLPKYLEFEEGVASTMQRLSSNKPSIQIAFRPYPILISMKAAGVESQDIFNFLEQTYTDPDSKRLFQSWIYRTHQGTITTQDENGNSVHAIYNKDAVYSEGVIKMSKFIDALNSPNQDVVSAASKINDKLLSAKFDATNYRHLQYLQEEGIIDLTKVELKAYILHIMGKQK